jgi:hypothetical protein
MLDRYGWEYLPGYDKVGNRLVVTHLVSRARQEKKSFGLSGRQWVKLRKLGGRNVRNFLKNAKAQ